MANSKGLNLIPSILEPFFKVNAVMRPVKAKSGQGTLEMVLLLAIAVGIALAVASPFMKAVQIYGNALFNDYYTCLLELGSMINDPQAVDACPRPKFSAAYEAAKGAQDSKNPKDADQEQSKGKTPSSTAGSKSFGRTGATENSSAASGSTGNKRIPLPKSSFEATGGYGDGSASEGAGGVGSKRAKRRSERKFTIADSSEGPQQNALIWNGRVTGTKPQTKEIPITRAPSGAEGGAQIKSKTFIQKPVETKKATAEERGELDIAWVLRLFLIIAIVIGLLVFFGGQIQQQRQR